VRLLLDFLRPLSAIRAACCDATMYDFSAGLTMANVDVTRTGPHDGMCAARVYRHDR
jgi:hypothetical protein